MGKMRDDFHRNSGSRQTIWHSSATGKNIFVAIKLEEDKQLGHKTVRVNDILTIHGREIENIVLPILENRSLKWADKEKRLQWLSSAESNPQAIAKETLDSAAKVVKDFENPTLGEEIRFRRGSGGVVETARQEYDRRVRTKTVRGRDGAIVEEGGRKRGSNFQSREIGKKNIQTSSAR